MSPTPQPAAAPPNLPPARAAAVWIALGTVLAGIAIRAVTSFEPYPCWSGDPTRLPSPVLGLTPLSGLVLNLATIVASGVGWIALGRAPRWLLIGAGLLAPGAGILWWHAAGAALQLGDATIGSAWVSSAFAALFLAAGARDEWFRRAGLAVLVGIVAMLAIKGASQYFLEHPRSVRTFQETKAQVLAAQGWREDSPMARAFERRALQREATGWWGLSNVYGSVAAAGLSAMLGMLGAMASQRARGWPVALGIALALGGGLWFSQSKGAALAAGAGVAFAAALWVLRPARARWLGVLALLIPIGAMILIAGRGMIGERAGELSLLFRWFYAQGALRLLGEHPWLGVGPDGFQSAYLLVKDPLSPEAPTSPHGIVLDWASAMGVAGLAWGGAWLVLAWRVGARAGEDDPREAPMPAPATRIVLGCAAIATLAGSAWEREALTPDGALVRLLGLLAAGACGLWVLRAAHGRASRWALACASASVLAHAPIEMTLSNPGSVPWGLAMLALAGGARARDADGPAWARWAVAAAGLGWGIVVAGWLGPIAEWQRALRRGYDAVAPLRELEELREGAREAYLARLGRLAGARVEAEQSEGALVAVRRALLERARAELERAADALPSHFPTGRSVSSLALDLAGVARSREEARAWLERAREEARHAAERSPHLSPAWAWLGVVGRSGWQVLGEKEWLERSCEAWTRAARLDPGSAAHAVELARANAALGAGESAGRWACEALARDARLRLDPLVGLGERERGEMRALCGLGGP